MNEIMNEITMELIRMNKLANGEHINKRNGRISRTKDARYFNLKSAWVNKIKQMCCYI